MADKDFEKLKQWYEAIQNAKKNADGTYTVDGKKVSASQYRQYKKSSKIVYDEAVKKVMPPPLAPLGPSATTHRQRLFLKQTLRLLTTLRLVRHLTAKAMSFL